MRLIFYMLLLLCVPGALAQENPAPAPAPASGGDVPEAPGEPRAVTPAEARKFKIFRGEFLRTEVLRVELVDLYDCILARDAFPEVAIRFNRKQHQIVHEVRIYQAVQRVVKEQEDVPSLAEYHPLKNRVVRGEETTRDSIRGAGVWKGERFLVGGAEVVTDGKGRVFDRPPNRLGIWEHFDDLSHVRMQLRIAHARMGEQTLDIYRVIPRRRQCDERSLDEDIRNDVLFASRIDFSQMSTDPERERLEVRIGFPGEVAPGDEVAVEISIANQGKAPTCCLLGRIFSSEAWLNGKLFYFGMVKPGDRQVFRRTIQAPGTLPTDEMFADVVFCDSWNPLPGLRRGIRMRARRR